nr:hypothetical protein [Niveispirillum sp.]
MFNQDRIGIVSELDGRRFQNAACIGDGTAQFYMGLQTARQPGHVVDDDDDTAVTALADEGEHRLHAGTVDQAAGHIVLKHLDHLIALPACELAAARFLRPQPVAQG